MRKNTVVAGQMTISEYLKEIEANKGASDVRLSPKAKYKPVILFNAKSPSKSKKLRTCQISDALPCLITSCGSSSAANTFLVLEQKVMDQNIANGTDDNPLYRARKLTPEECFAFMGLSAEDVEKCRALGVSDSELYRQAGNGIVSNCVELLAEHLYKAQYDNNFICTDERKEILL